ncbi:MAG: pyridoxamine 5'-phosphate oxidase family protein [Pseudomonadota bacterium]
MSNEQKLWDLVEKNNICMMVTKEPSGAMRGRPMHAIIERDAREIWFFTRLDQDKKSEVADGDVCLSFSDPDSSDYVSISGRATVTQDRDRVEEYWSRFVDAWFPEGKDSDVVGLIRVAVDKGEYWDGESSSIISVVKMLLASEQVEMPDMGENEKVAITRH